VDYRISSLEWQIDLLKKQREWDKDELKREIEYAAERSKRQVYYKLQGCVFWTLVALWCVLIVIIWAKVAQTR
jgi:hypothetical protein